MAEIRRLREWWKIAIVAVIALELLGGLSGWLSNSGYGNRWFDALAKPSFMPPGWLFGLVWPVLYAMMGIAFALLITAPASRAKDAAITLFLVQLGLNFAWSPLFFGAHDMGLAKWVIFVMTVVATIAAGRFWRINKWAGLLLLPYLAWLVFASVLNTSIEALNPGASASLFRLLAN